MRRYCSSTVCNWEPCQTFLSPSSKYFLPLKFFVVLRRCLVRDSHTTRSRGRRRLEQLCCPLRHVCVVLTVLWSHLVLLVLLRGWPPPDPGSTSPPPWPACPRWTGLLFQPIRKNNSHQSNGKYFSHLRSDKVNAVINPCILTCLCQAGPTIEALEDKYVFSFHTNIS